jgi:hypothetical protein
MNRVEEDWLPRCTGCGAELLPETYPTFTFGISGVLCFPCAVHRGGRFDARREHWTEPPALGDLGPERED